LLKLKPGDTVGRYVIEELIGRGGMGCVYRAQDSRLHRKVALKMLLAPSEDEPADKVSSPPSNAAARMLREARAAASFDHPNAVQVFDVGEIDGTPYIAMELIVGQTLTALVTDEHFTWPTRLRWLVDAARALGAAHRAGLVHRDVKPDNVMVRNDGVTKVLDFGIVRHASALNPMAATFPVGFPSLTQRGSVLGTPHYMAPEQIRGLTLDARADQFSWGVMAFELLTQKMPWGTGLEAISLALTSPAPSLHDGCPELPDAVDSAVLRALAKTPDDRFATMDELALAIEPFAAAAVNPGDVSGPVSSISLGAGRLPTTGGGHATPLLQKKKATLRARRYGAGLLVLVLGASAAYATSRSLRPTPVASAPPRPPAVTMIDLPRPTSTKPEALAAYLGGLQAVRDGSREMAIDAFTRAVALDPSMGAAHLRLAIFGYAGSSTTARQEFEKAEGLRSTMSEHDQALLVAMEPVIQRQPCDWLDAQTRLNAAIAKFPNDAEMLFHLGSAAFLIDPAAAGPPLDAALAADPKFALAWAFKAEALAYQGDFEGADRGLVACLKISPSAVSCLYRLVELDELRGDCAAKEKHARRIATF
jgi:serine/threonine protein kinase/tetratricopeptide (TPR) repeat protein